MQRVLHWHGSVKSYKQSLSSGKIELSSSEKSCPKCAVETNKHGSYQRDVFDAEGETERVGILRRLCSQCRKTISFLPSFVGPWQRVSLEVIKGPLWKYIVEGQSLDRVAEEFPLSRDVLRRCVEWCSRYLDSSEEKVTRFQATITPTFEPERNALVESYSPPKQRGKTLLNLRKLLIKCEQIRLCLPEKFPANLLGGFLAVFRCVCRPLRC